MAASTPAASSTAASTAGCQARIQTPATGRTRPRACSPNWRPRVDAARTAGLPGAKRRVPTVAEFAGVQVTENGRVIPRDGLVQEETWPWTHTREGKLRKESAKRRYAEALRGFVR